MAGLTVFILYDCVFEPLDSLDCCAKLGFREFGDLENSHGFWAFVDNLNQLMIQLRVQLLILQKKGQSVEHGENLVGNRIKIWWRKDEIFYEGVVKSYDCIKKRHKVLYDDGDEDLLDLKGKHWELANYVQLGQGPSRKVSTPQSDTVFDQGEKLSYDDDVDEELSNLKWEHLALVDNVSPI
nr:phospholipase-like protein [Tanacetum cinerariifolium]